MAFLVSLDALGRWNRKENALLKTREFGQNGLRVLSLVVVENKLGPGDAPQEKLKKE